MTTYKAIHGKTVQHLSSDPDSAAYEGQMWFNTTSTDYKTIIKVAGSWSTGGDINQGRYSGGSATEAPATAGLIFGGDSPAYDNTETYDGSTWAEVNDLNTGRGNLAGAGTQTAGLASGGEVSPKGQSEEYDGTCWAEGHDLNTARAGLTGNGPQTASLSTGGKIGENFQVLNELYNGTSWAESGDLNTARAYHSTTGDSTAGLAAGGSSPYTVNSEEFNGTSWTEGNNLNVAKAYIRGGFGTQNASLVSGGYSPSGTFATTEQYDGTSWTEIGDLPTATRDHFGSGSVTAGLASGGRSAPGSTLTEGYEWDFTSTLAAGAWTSGGTHPTSNLANVGSAGTQTAAISVGGGSATTTCIEYNGTAWSANPNAYPQGSFGLHGAGTATTGLFFGGRGSTPPSYQAEAFTFDGTSFSAVNDINSKRYYHGGAGTATAAVGFGGHDGSDRGYTEEFDGTNWAESGDLNTARDQGASAGTQTAALFVGGSPGGAGATVVEEYNGTSWSEVTDIATATQTSSGNGIQTAALIAGGETHPGSATIAEVYSYDGSTFTTVADMSTSRYAHGELSGSAPANLSVVFAGNGGGTTTEEWTVAQNIKIITD